MNKRSVSFQKREKKYKLDRAAGSTYHNYYNMYNHIIEEIIDARTSDAIALALRFSAPIFTYKTILDKAGIFLKFSSKDKGKDENDESIIVDEILQEGETVEIEQAATDGYTELTIDELNKELDKAVANEDYEKAANLRDEISKRN